MGDKPVPAVVRNSFQDGYFVAGAAVAQERFGICMCYVGVVQFAKGGIKGASIGRSSVAPSGE
jgi:hypothetical protein